MKTIAFTAVDVKYCGIMINIIKNDVRIVNDVHQK